ncbi:hypothetical protein DICA1_F09340 [Diutina catenulata]
MASPYFDPLADDLMTPAPLVPPCRPSVRPRSSSSTSVVSNGTPVMVPHSVAPTPKNHRSLSVVSLESPRGSVVSEDQRLTRNNSLTSLVSLTPGTAAGGGADPESDDKRLSQTPVLSASLAINIPGHLFLSDDDSELETPSRLKRPHFRSRPSATSSSVTSAPSSHSVQTGHHGVASPVEHDPLSLKANLFDNTPHRRSLGRATDATSPLSLSSEFERRPSLGDGDLLPPSALKKRVKPPQKPANIQQSILKRKLAAPTHIESTKFITTNVSESGKKTYMKQPVLESMVQKNKLIQHLNQKWNKPPEQDKRAVVSSRKRRWSDDDSSVGGTDADDDDHYL